MKSRRFVGRFRLTDTSDSHRVKHSLFSLMTMVVMLSVSRPASVESLLSVTVRCVTHYKDELKFSMTYTEWWKNNPPNHGDSDVTSHQFAVMMSTLAGR